AELVYQDEINGSILMIPDKVMDTIYTKYFKGLIHYEGIQRVDRYPMPREALREAVLNAVVHRSYETGNPIQIKIFDDKVYIYNDARLPAGVTEEDLHMLDSIPVRYGANVLAANEAKLEYGTVSYNINAEYLSREEIIQMAESIK
ncbi:MAG: hypothetical protein FWD23_14460, partial [Oscillospiraceae bacterium]|nr:hypothetical protein [Oscillospiraceae bacterium]